jgi:hypothetical protein
MAGRSDGIVATAEQGFFDWLHKERYGPCPQLAVFYILYVCGVFGRFDLAALAQPHLQHHF